MTHYRKHRCPSCGHEWTESVAWRGSAWHPDWEIADFDEASRALPQLEDLRDKIGERYRITIDDYVYWRQKGKNQHIVHRVPYLVYVANGHNCRGKGSYLEKTKDPFQIPLVVETSR